MGAKETQIKLQNALLKIIAEKSIDSVTVKELIETIDISRSTFYLYYDSIDTLFQDINEIYITELYESFNDYKNISFDDRYFEIPHHGIKKSIRIIRKNSDVYKILLLEHNGSYFHDRCNSFCLKYIVEKCIQSKYITDSFLYEKVISTHILSSYHSLIEYLLYNKTIETDDELAIAFYRIFFAPFRIYTKQTQ